jgi:hypothetical protein
MLEYIDEITGITLSRNVFWANVTVVLGRIMNKLIYKHRTESNRTEPNRTEPNRNQHIHQSRVTQHHTSAHTIAGSGPSEALEPFLTALAWRSKIQSDTVNDMSGEGCDPTGPLAGWWMLIMLCNATPPIRLPWPSSLASIIMWHPSYPCLTTIADWKFDKEVDEIQHRQCHRTINHHIDTSLACSDIAAINHSLIGIIYNTITITITITSNLQPTCGWISLSPSQTRNDRYGFDSDTERAVESITNVVCAIEQHNSSAGSGLFGSSQRSHQPNTRCVSCSSTCCICLPSTQSVLLEQHIRRIDAYKPCACATAVVELGGEA